MDNRSGQIMGVAITFLVLTWITVGLRCYVRKFIVKGFGLDDKLMVVTLVLFTAYLACQIGGAVHGSGRHRAVLSNASASQALHFWYFCEIFYTISTSLLKIAVGFFLLRITVQKYHIWLIRFIMIVAGFLGVGYTLLVIFQCQPISYWWDLDPTHEGKCIDASLVMILTFVVSGLNAFADWCFAILPVLIVKDLQMKKRMKFVISGVISLAAIGSTATIVRLPYTTTLKPYKGDFLHRTTDFAIWTTVEVGLGITAGSIATLKPLLKSSFLTSRSGNLYTPNAASGSNFHSRLGSKLGRQTPLGLHDLDRSGKAGGTKTTVTGGRDSSDSDEEKFLAGGGNTRAHGWEAGISKSVTTTVVEERRDFVVEEDDQRERLEARGLRKPLPSTPTMERRRHGSPGGDSASTLAEEERGRPVVNAYGAF